MRTLQQWFDSYAVSHQNPTNISIHFICVPAIFFSVVGLFMSIPSGFLNNVLPHPIIANWAFVLLIITLVLFYFRLSVKVGIQMLLFSAFCLVLNYVIAQYVPLVYFSLALFIIAWIGQFYGHKVEGQKPSFIDDLQFLLVGPAWVMYKLFGK
ncbi:Mpo1-like protein [Olleya sp. UBA1516]|uniref:Mpo1 family 2-hydroxy fatty acid dioxygenase n=1 Tax=Olleya sp. UBA1516 TaxID=1947013 RepID=UPI0025E679A0|nr:Mpo1-like protein [Olleya sp. UBA1516]|tara:strand:- start:152086 stop:152544 length:459 start_codon:yes stop_codon:yes gene_type:complete